MPRDRQNRPLRLHTTYPNIRTWADLSQATQPQGPAGPAGPSRQHVDHPGPLAPHEHLLTFTAPYVPTEQLATILPQSRPATPPFRPPAQPPNEILRRFGAHSTPPPHIPQLSVRSPTYDPLATPSFRLPARPREPRFTIPPPAFNVPRDGIEDTPAHIPQHGHESGTRDTTTVIPPDTPGHVPTHTEITCLRHDPPTGLDIDDCLSIDDDDTPHSDISFEDGTQWAESHNSPGSPMSGLASPHNASTLSRRGTPCREDREATEFFDADEHPTLPGKPSPFSLPSMCPLVAGLTLLPQERRQFRHHGLETPSPCLLLVVYSCRRPHSAPLGARVVSKPWFRNIFPMPPPL
jgi:hypothetical protein